jgi:hypothetical protein
MKRFVLNGSEHTDGFHRSVGFFQTQHASFSVRGQLLAVAMEHIRTYLLALTSGKTTARPPVFVCRSKQVEISWI